VKLKIVCIGNGEMMSFRYSLGILYAPPSMLQQQDAVDRVSVKLGFTLAHCTHTHPRSLRFDC
jgi:hypothetical protein